MGNDHITNVLIVHVNLLPPSFIHVSILISFLSLFLLAPHDIYTKIKITISGTMSVVALLLLCFYIRRKVDYENKGNGWEKLYRTSSVDWQKNIETIVDWSPFRDEDGLLQQVILFLEAISQDSR